MRTHPLRERRFVMKPQGDPHDCTPSLADQLSRVFRRMREWAAAKAARLERVVKRHERDMKAQFIRGVSYGVGSGAVSILVVWWERWH